MKRLYEKPMLTEQSVGSVNKFQVGYHEQGSTDIDGVPVKAIVERYGSPVFVFSEKRIRETVRGAKRAFTTRYPKAAFGWSYKTNYLGAICSIMHQEGSLAEVVSLFEYEKARGLGVPGEKIIFNGPSKTLEALQLAASEGAMINIDNYDEMYRLEEVVSKLNRKIDVGIRLNLDAGIYPAWSRFGFNYESVQAYSAAKRIQKGGKLSLTGLHCHIGTFILTPAAYRQEVEKLLYFAGVLKKDFDITLDYIDIGGGLPSKNKLKGVYLPPDVAVPPAEDFADAICNVLLEKTKPNERPAVYIESGRALIDEAGYLITSVTGSKRLPDGRKAYIIDAGVNLLITTSWYDIPVKVGVEIEGVAEDVWIFGPLCMNIDVVRDSVKLPPLSTGTPLVFNPVGAYCVTEWMQFIEYRPNVVLVSPDGKLEVIREREALDDVIAKERVPDRLKAKF